MPRVGQPAPLTPKQRMLVEALLAELAPTEHALARQAKAAFAFPNCECGCPSISFAMASGGSIPPGFAPTSPSPTTLTSPRDNVDLIARSRNGSLLALLSVRGGRLTELDCLSMGDAAHFPPYLESLEGWTFSAESADTVGT